MQNDIVARIEDICKTHDIASVLGNKKRIMVCPLPQHAHKHNTPSFSIFWRGGKQWWRCHGNCNTEGDIVDLVGFLRIPGYQRYNLTLRQRAAAILDNNFEIKIVIPEPQPTLAGDEWAQFLPPGDEVVAYGASRGLLPETMRAFRFGQHGHYMTMPCFEESRLIGVKLRNIREGNRFWQLPGSRQGLFNIDAIRYKPGLVFIVKGEIPCALLVQMGYRAVAPTGGEGGWTDRWRTALALCQRVVIGDNDAPGKILAEKRGVLLGAAVVFPPDKYKDIDQYILAEPAGATETLNQWKAKHGWELPA